SAPGATLSASAAGRESPLPRNRPAEKPACRAVPLDRDQTGDAERMEQRLDDGRLEAARDERTARERRGAREQQRQRQRRFAGEERRRQRNRPRDLSAEQDDRPRHD